ncbi:MAG: hypothetical protein CMQ43_06610 [Gammaproteobacteria bacterium]|nr:hypothetical protein [Gammaproteobacteria bacterium]MBK80572.1 hypothetical protein [Gammaproteobacteria bacterium]|tara:strand:+ start:2091 stop:2780 length:690 start_codon:yes stop_codon:yes gene_type:complete
MIQDEPTAGRPPARAPRHEGSRDLAMLTRANHEMRSPLSVILGVFELLENSPGLAPAEAPFVELGHDAALDLLAQADALRLYSALQRDLITLEPEPVEVAPLARDHLEAACAGLDVDIDPSTGDNVRAHCDSGYLGVVLTALCRQLSLGLPSRAARPHLVVEAHRDGDRAAVVEVRRADAEAPAAQAAEPAGDLAVTLDNAYRLVALMGGSILLDVDAGYLALRLPQAG